MLRFCAEAFTYDIIDVVVIGFGYFFLDYYPIIPTKYGN